MIFTSPHDDIVIPDDVSLTNFIFQNIGDFTDKAAITDGSSGRSLTYGELFDNIKACAAGLADKGFSKGDVFAIYLPNVPEYAVIFFGVAKLGGINTTINPLYTAEELANQLNDSGARYLLTIPLFLENAQKAAAQSSIEEIFVLGEAEGTTPFASLMKPGAPVPDVNINPKEDLVVLPYSSGTTGLPKGVMLTHYNLVANLAQIDAALKIAPSDNQIAVLPFFHIYGMIVVMAHSLLNGASLVSMPRFDLEQFLQLLQDYKITRACLVPPIILGLAKHPIVDNYDLSSLDIVVSAAAPAGGDLIDSCTSRLKCKVIQAYGMTEMSPAVHISYQEVSKIKPGSIGVLVPDTEAMIVDTENNTPLGPNQDGELWVRGPQCMPGYLNNEQATSESIDSEGWYHSGDIAHADDDGYFFIVDRLKELIKYKGMQVAPAELEALLLTNEAIADAAVVPYPDEEAGEIPKAFVVLKDEISADSIMDFVAEHVAPHKKIRKVEVIDEIPKSPSGKILRRFLRERDRVN
jgi:acyl-CoA synthetase (AMP-forming)/AMP-acid ligase II